MESVKAQEHVENTVTKFASLNNPKLIVREHDRSVVPKEVSLEIMYFSLLFLLSPLETLAEIIEETKKKQTVWVRPLGNALARIISQSTGQLA